MTVQRVALYGLLVVVAGAAAVLSFAALRDLAELCGFDPRLAWLLPVVVDAGAAAASIVWLAGQVPDHARRYARALALVLLALSVLANALGHALAAFSLAPTWWVVVIVSAVAPAVLGAVVHLVVLAARAPAPVVVVEAPAGVVEETRQPDASAPLVEEVALAVDAGDLDDRGLSSAWDTAPMQVVPLAPAASPPASDGETWEEKRDRLLAEGAGRPTLRRELGITDHEAKALKLALASRTNGHKLAGVAR